MRFKFFRGVAYSLIRNGFCRQNRIWGCYLHVKKLKCLSVKPGEESKSHAFWAGRRCNFRTPQTNFRIDAYILWYAWNRIEDIVLNNNYESFGLQDQVAIVTGASQGIGEVLAVDLTKWHAQTTRNTDLQPGIWWAFHLTKCPKIGSKSAEIKPPFQRLTCNGALYYL